jgi:hypothetical protein
MAGNGSNPNGGAFGDPTNLTLLGALAGLGQAGQASRLPITGAQVWGGLGGGLLAGQQAALKSQQEQQGISKSAIENANQLDALRSMAAFSGQPMPSLQDIRSGKFQGLDWPSIIKQWMGGNQPSAGGIAPPPTLPPPPNTAANGGSPSPTAGIVKGSWFGNYAGNHAWEDKTDSGLQANGAPVSAGPGIALPTKETLGQVFDVTAPNGRTYRLPQTDVGPAAWTKRGIDINAPAAELMGYKPDNFPTDGELSGL